VLEHETLNAILDERNVEVDQETDGFLCQSQVCERLKPENGIHLVHGFEFHDDPIIYEQINPKSGPQRYAFIFHIHWNLPFNA
jgi:hypothetical protein